jgi:hypothetical protein
MILSIVERRPATREGPPISLPPLQFYLLAKATVAAVEAVTADETPQELEARFLSRRCRVQEAVTERLRIARPQASYSFALMALISGRTSAPGTGIE